VNVDEEDVARVIQIMSEMFQDSATDPVTGKVDLAITHTGHTKSENSRITLFENIMKGLLGDSYSMGASIQEIITEMQKSGRWSDDVSITKFIKQMKKDETIYESSDKHYKLN
jgi:DNA replicative helicase MCM subunit Mcm2 (Cdc46/Mcm family)